MNQPRNAISSLDPRPKDYICYYNNYSIKTTANAACFGLGYVLGVQSVIMETSTFNPIESNVAPPDACIVPKDITFKKAKEKVCQYFLDHHGENIDYGDLMDALNIHLPLIVDVCAELESEGKIAGIN